MTNESLEYLASDLHAKYKHGMLKKYVAWNEIEQSERDVWFTLAQFVDEKIEYIKSQIVNEQRDK